MYIKIQLCKNGMHLQSIVNLFTDLFLHCLFTFCEMDFAGHIQRNVFET